jgi:hypothetical protein
MMNAQIEFKQAWIKHRMFKTHLRAYLANGTGETAHLSDPRACSMGSWLNDIAVKYSHVGNSVLEVSYLHEEVHHEAARVIRLYHQNKVDAARDRLTQIEAMDNEILQALNQLEREITA